MAAWIKFEHTTPDKPEMVTMAEILGIDQDAVIGKCLRIWIWADQQSVDGDALSVTKSFLDRITGCKGFSDALESVGWLSSGDGKLKLPNFDRHNGQTAKNRALTANRMQKSRNAPSVTFPVTQSSPDQIRSDQIRSDESDARNAPSVTFPVTQSSPDKSNAEIEALAQKVMDAYPLRAKKDGRAINRTIHDQDLLISKIRKHPDFEWERAARLMNHIDTPPNMTTWLLNQPDKVQLAQNARLEAESRPGAEGSGTPYVGGRKKVPVR